MLISIPVPTNVTATNVVEDTQIYNVSNSYIDKTLVQYDPNGGTNYDIYGVFNVDSAHSLSFYSVTAPYAVADEKTYTKAKIEDEMTYTVIGTGKFDTVAIGGVLGDTISVYFKDIYGNVIYSIIDRQITNNIDSDGRHDPQPVTEVLYSPIDLEHGSTVDVVVKRTGNTVEIGTILCGLSLDSGFTHLTFTNKFIDYSPTETDQWGNTVYIEGLKVNVHTGSVDIPIANYDFMNRTMLAIGGNKVILNGYGLKNNNKPDNADGHFYATMMIGRMKNFSLATKLDNKRLGEIATYRIELEEVV